ncbi:MAG: hypothetical protein WDW38_003064 [Sanguina aurantia]
MFGSTRLSRALGLLLISLYLVQYFVPSSTSYLALVPGRTLPCVWNLVTAGFLTTNVFKLIVEVAAVLLLVRLVEPLYGSREFLKFMFVLDFSICFMVFAGVYLVFAITSSGTLLYTEFTGFHGILAALLVAIKQVMPDHELKLLGPLKITVKYVPLLCITLASLLLVYLQQLSQLPFLLLGSYNAWVYLRFFQQQPDTQLYGDPSDDFRFSGFFPPLLAPLIDGVGAVCGTVTRLRHSSEARLVVMKPLIPVNTPSMLGSDVADANRRRERGAKALEERLGLKKLQDLGDLEAPHT